MALIKKNLDSASGRPLFLVIWGRICRLRYSGSNGSGEIARIRVGRCSGVIGDVSQFARAK